MRHPLFMAPLILCASLAMSPAFGSKPQGQEGDGYRSNTHPSASEFVAEIDADGDQKISEQEYLDAAKERFSKWDLDADGYISSAELQKVVQLYERMNQSADQDM